MNIQPEPMPEPDQRPENPPAQEIMEETTKPNDETDTTYFFPNLTGDGRSVSVTAPDRETAEKHAKEQLAQETAQTS